MERHMHLSAWWIGVSGELVIYYVHGLPALPRHRYPAAICLN